MGEHRQSGSVTELSQGVSGHPADISRFILAQGVGENRYGGGVAELSQTASGHPADTSDLVLL